MSIAALEQALSFLSRTDLIAVARQQPLPDGVTELLKISSGDNEVLLAAQESSRHSQEDVRHAAQFYAQQILFSPDSDHYRVLGVDPDDPEAKIKLHYRLLVRWLHPDRNPSDWEVVFSERINRAWHALRTPERRWQYDEQLISERLLNKDIVPGREIKPAQWRNSKTDAHFMSARTIKRLPIAVFSLLGVGAVLALFLFSQMQPDLQPTSITNNNAAPLAATAQAPNAESMLASVPKEAIVTINEDTGLIEPASRLFIEENKTAPMPVVIAEPMPVLSSAETSMPAIAVPKLAVKKPAVPVLTQKKQIPAEKLLETASLPSSPVVVSLAASEDKPKSKRSRQNKTALAKANAALALEIPVAVNTSATQTAIANDASVKQFLQRFSRVYAEGDYFALHNLFTKDLSIIGAAPQRTVLRSYRQLFENSQSRVIALDHVSWLGNDENIVVIASYQAQILPRGKGQIQSSRGDIRLDLRMENGQLRIIRLQSGTKNG